MPNITNRYYPTLATIVDTDAIPDILGFVKEGVISVLGKIHYKDLQYSKSAKGDAAFYSLSIVTKKRLDFEIPGTGIYFVLNPDLGSGADFNVSVFPITLDYEWKVLAYLRGFDLTGFSYSPKEIFEVALKILNISEEEVISRFMNVFVEPANSDTTVLEQYVADVNAEMETTLIADEETTLRSMSEDLYAETDDFGSSAGFSTYISVTDDIDETWIKLKRFFRSLLPNDIEEYIKDLLLPKISTSLELSAAIEFPRNMLRPVYLSDGSNPFDEGDIGDTSRAFSVIEGDENDDPKVLLSFGEVLFTASTDDGFGYSMDLALNTNVPAEIGKTGLIIDIEDVKVDLFENKNIPEANADGRPNEFKGVFIKNATITFPNFFTPSEEEDNATIVARNLLIGSEGGISGTIGIKSAVDEEYFEEVNLNFVVTVERDGEGNVIGYSGFTFNPGTKDMTIIGNKAIINEIVDPENPELMIDDITTEDAEFEAYIPPAGVTVIDADNNYYNVTNTGVVTNVPAPDALMVFNLFGTVVTIEDFFITFSKNKVVSSTVTGKIHFTGPDIELDMEIDFTDGFRIHLSNDPGIDVIDGNIITLTLRDFELGRVNEKFFVALSAKLQNNLEIPFINKFVPNVIDAHNLRWTQGDGFDYNLTLAWVNGLNLGLSNDGPPELAESKFRIPFNQKKDGGLFKLDAIDLTVKPVESGVSTSVELVGASLNLKDKVVFTVDGLGAEVLLTKVDDDTEEGGNIGPFDTAFNLIPPKGLGIKVDAKAVTGGGYVYLDFEKGRYVGVAELKIKDKVTVKVIGIITTKLPSGEKGNSILLLVTAEFTPVDLAFGFTLNGVGGLVAINRTMNLQALRDGVKNNAIDNVMFPDDPVKNIAQIVSDLETIFPVQKGRYTFGIMGLIGWGTLKGAPEPTSLVTLEIGLMLEVPKPVRLAVLGVIKSILPTEKNDVVKLQINFVGTIDFGAKYITFDASIYESNFVKFGLAGDMAFRLKWGDEPNFLFSVGGFHPAYEPPPLNLPTMDRLMINFLAEDNPRLTLSIYLAITSNTVQMGALLDFYYKITKNIQVIGALGFDILIQFSPFYLRAELYAMMAVIRNNQAVLSVSLYGMLEGPKPWHVQGKAEFVFLKMNLKANFDKTFGEEDATTLPDAEVMPLVLIEANKSKNWEGISPAQSNLLVSLKKQAEGVEEMILSHPNGNLRFAQQIVPLGMTINKFGKQVPSDYQYFTFGIVDTDGTAFETTATKEFFAPAEFVELSDNEKLARKSFEKMDAGLKISDSDSYKTSAYRTRQLAYERIVYDSTEFGDKDDELQFENADNFQTWVNNNDTSNSELGRKNKAKSNFTPNKLKMAAETFKIANLEDLSVFTEMDEELSFDSEAEAHVAMAKLFIDNPELVDQIDVVLEHELV